ncbi:MAG: hypothetical protein QOD99_32 [Chthoniobacter sp.]|jgi:hypothetical protein|nr:hypothetical protein [Chthoniobacter sp.]
MRMKWIHLLVATSCLAGAEEITTIDGQRTFDDSTISRTEPDGLVITTGDGIVKVPFSNLSKDIQRRYHFDAAAAEQFKKRLTDQQRAVAAQAEKDREDVRATLAEQRKQGEEALAVHQSVREISAGAFKAKFRVSQIKKGGALGTMQRFFTYDTMEKHGMTSIPTVATGLRPSVQVFVFGLPKAVDNESYTLTLYPAGRYQYGAVAGAGPTVAAYATSAELAFKALSLQQAE